MARTPISVLPYPGRLSEPPTDETPPTARNRPTGPRVWIFLGVLTVTLAVGLATALLRTPVYRSAASVAIVPPATLTTPGTRSQPVRAPEAISELALAQRQIMLSEPVLREALESIDEGGATPSIADDVSELRQVLSVVHLADTRILELAAEGDDPDQVAALVNAWLDAYLKSTVSTESDSAEKTRAVLRDQLDKLQARVQGKRTELESFRKTHDIVSMQREENRTLAKLNGLTASLSRATEENVAASSRHRALLAAQAEGKPIVAPNEQRQILALEERAVDLEQELAELGRIYTPRYMLLDRDTETVRRKLALVERRIGEKKLEAENAAISEAEQAVSSTAQRIGDLREQLDGLEGLAAGFTARFAEHEALQEELGQLETLAREIQDRLVQTEVTVANVAPGADVLSRAHPNHVPVRPDYVRDSIIAVGASLLISVVAVWLYGFLIPVEAPKTIVEAQIVSAPGAAGQQLNAPPTAPLLEQSLARELSTDEARALVQSADDKTRALILMLLSGLRLHEAISVRRCDVNFRDRCIEVSGVDARAPGLSDSLAATLRQLDESPEDPTHFVLANEPGYRPDEAELAALVTTAARTAGLRTPESVTPAALRHSYIAYLARQGAGLDDIQHLVGKLTNAEMAAYAIIGPPDSGRSMEEVNPIHPATRPGRAT